MLIIEKNTELFYKELHSNCNIDTLLELAKQGIFLYSPLFKYEKIKDNNYVIDISILARQYFMINTKIQYNRYFEIMDNFENFNLFKLYHNKYECSRLIIINEFFINQLIADNNNKNLMNIIKYSKDDNLFLKYFYKHEIISLNVYNLFNHELYNNIFFELFEFLYFNNENEIFKKSIESFNFDNLILIFNTIINKGYDINIIKYVAKQLETLNIKMPPYVMDVFKIPLNFPLKVIKLYTSKIYSSNCIILKHENKYFESLVNASFSEKYLFHCKYLLDNINNINYFNELIRYEIDFNLINKSKTTIENLKKYPLYKCRYENINEYKEKKYNIYNKNNKNIFSKYVLNDNDKLQHILTDINYIFKLKINFSKEVFLIRICYIISLLHNGYNKNIIEYLISITHLSNYKIYYKNNKICFYHKLLYEKNSYYIETLFNVKNETLKKYICLLEYDETF